MANALSRNIYLDDVKLISIALQKENKRNKLGLSRFQVAKSGRVRSPFYSLPLLLAGVFKLKGLLVRWVCFILHG